MREIEPPFEINYEGKIVQITEHEIQGKRVFHVDFAGLKNNLTVTVAFNRKDEKFWTSIPEGRQTEAEDIGKLIGQYIRNKK